MQSTQVPQRDELVRRVSEIAPVLRANAAWSEENRRLHDESIAALADAGVFRMRVTGRYGGYECDARTLVDAGMELGRADGSTAFTVALWWITSWMLGLFPDEIQEEVFSTTDVRTCGTLAPTGTAVPKPGGIVVSGRWAFNTGAAHSQWKLLSAMAPAEGGGEEPILAVVPIGDVEMADDWNVTALQGTGSVTATASDLFIPEGRYVRIAPLLNQESFSELNAGTPMYRAPMIPAVSAATVGKIVGLAKAAREAFFERLPDRGIVYTGYFSQREAAVTHLQVAQAALSIDEAEFHAYRLADMVDGKSVRSEAWSLEERAYSRMAIGRVCELTKAAVDTYVMASGSVSIQRTAPLQRIQRDLDAITLHGLNLPATNLELYGRILCGLEPNSPYV
ncbi:acyl-CoA dehydrogenase family protein [Amycolatopsis palatopharyngis]|uniref:acyl-CoA dehydrogenase family protein n=1 Tax=Amycolatopsis palatopharyngis TaxID=187982 RepID=UPI000E23D72D|nr:acyl-CoA dehydrogenase family protein [Amycolatopsis palatopharyngis]